MKLSEFRAKLEELSQGIEGDPDVLSVRDYPVEKVEAKPTFSFPGQPQLAPTAVRIYF